MGITNLIKLPVPECNNSKILLLIDTGADVSVIKLKCLPDKLWYYNYELLQLREISDPKSFILGYCFLTIDNTGTHNFHIINNDFELRQNAL